MISLFNQYKPSQGIYIHIPHCLQKCHYCDFATVLLDQGPGLDDYTQLILDELELRLLKEIELTSIYFGGGTPSLLGPKRIEKIINKIRSVGYIFNSNCEITLEINPGTLSINDLKDLKNAGVNRFSIGIQSFKDKTLNLIGREHSSLESITTLESLRSLDLNFTADLIIALPNENFKDFQENLNKLAEFQPNHISVYVLTIPQNHFLAQQMPKEDLLDELMDESESLLEKAGYSRYEISNYRKVGSPPSMHNLLYWNDQNYWGVGLGAHSYFKNEKQWGLRFWNPRTFKTYQAQLKKRDTKQKYPPPSQQETLQLNESLTDYCFTHLRQWDGISAYDLNKKYSTKIKNLVVENLLNLQKDGYIVFANDQWSLSKAGKKFADHVFRELCFSKTDIKDLNE